MLDEAEHVDNFLEEVVEEGRIVSPLISDNVRVAVEVRVEFRVRISARGSASAYLVASADKCGTY